MLELALTSAPSLPAVAWDPMTQQPREADTTFLFDPDGDAAAGFPIGQAGSIGLGGLIYATDSSAPLIVPGRFRKGVNPTAATNSFLWSPVDGLLGISEFTFEFWLKYTVDWSTISNQTFIFSNLTFGISASHVTCTIGHTQNPAVVGQYSFTVSAAISSGQYPANTWVSCAMTLKAGTLTLYLGKQGDSSITQVAQQSGYVSPVMLGGSDRQGGIELIGGQSNKTAAFTTLSDVRASRFARTPAVIPTITSTSTITVGATPTGATVQKLNGISKPVTGWDVTTDKNLSYPNATASATVKAQAGLAIVRSGKALLTTPILAGGTPDATHPSAGHSGAFCYDWQVLDRDLDWIINKMGCLAYVTLDGVPQILGGSVAPYTDLVRTTTTPQNPDGPVGTLVLSSSVATAPAASKCSYGGSVWSYASRGGSALTGTQLRSGPGGTIPGGSTVHIGPLTTGFSYNIAGDKGPPASIANEATIIGDLAYHVLVEKGLGSSIFGWGLWNEPDQASEWTGGDTADYNALYGAAMPLIKAIDSSQKVGGPETNGFGNGGYITALMAYCVANSKPLDFISYHDYSGSPATAPAVQVLLAQQAAAAGLAVVPPLIVGEWGWQSANTGFSPGAGNYPWCQPSGGGNLNNPAPTPQPGHVDFAANDFNAAFHAMDMILMQGSGTIGAFHFTGNDTSLFDSNAVPQPLYNVMRMWGMIVGKGVLPVTLTADPGIQALAAQGGGHTYVLVSNLHYRLVNPQFPVTVDLSALAIADGTAVTAYLVDTTHSNAYDTLGATDVLTTVAVPAIVGGKTSITLAPRAVALLVI